MADLSITGEVVVTSEKAEGAFDRVGAKAGQMASKVQAEANKAGAAVDGIGTGAEKGAEKFTRAESRMREAIMKSTRELEMLGKTASQKFEAQLEFKGLDKAKFQPFLDELRNAEEATKKAESGLSGLGSAAQAAGRAMAVAFSGAAAFGVVGKLVEVQREFDVLNSSLKTVTGGSAAAEREMAWLKDFAKETPFGLAQATQGFVKMKALGLDPTRAALTSFGNTASAMGKDLNQMIEAVADASTGEFERLKEFGVKAKKEGDQVALTFQGVTTTLGNSAREIIQYLEDIGNTSFGGAMEERAKTLDGTIAALGDAWDELFRTVNANNVGSLIFDSVTLANGALEDATTILRAMGGAAQDAGRDTGALSTIQNGIATVFETVAVLGANLKYVLVQIGNEIGGLAAQAAQAAQFNFSGVAAIRQAMVADAEAARKEIDATTARILNARKAQEEYARYATRNASAATDPRRVDLGGSTTRKPVAGVDSKGINAANKELADQAKLIAELNGLTGSFAKEWDTLSAVYAKGGMSLDQLTQAQADLLAKQPAIKAAADEQAKAQQALSKADLEAAQAREKYITSLATGLDKIQAEIAAQEEATARMGLSKEAIADLDAAKLEMMATDLELQAIKAMDRNLDEQTYDALKQQAQAYRDLAKAKRAGAAKEVAVDAAKKASDEWQRTSDQINQSLTDALLRGFESGKDFAQNLRDTVVNMFKTMVLRPVISAVVNPVAGAITGALGLAGTANAGTSALGAIGTGASILNAGSALGGLGAVGGAIQGFATAATASVQSLLGMSGTVAQMTTSLAAAGHTAAAGVSAGAQAFSSIPGWGWAIAGTAALWKPLFGRKLKDTGIQGTFGGEAGFEGQQYHYYKGGLFRSDKTTYSPIDPELERSLAGGFNTVQKQVTDFAEALSLPTDRIKGFTTDIKISFNGLNEQQIQEKVAEALGGVGDEMAASLLEGTGAIIRSGETAGEALQRLGGSLLVVNDAFENLGFATFDASMSSGEAASQITDAFGGLEAFGTTTSAYFQAMYTEAEQTSAAMGNLSDSFADLGVGVPASADALRQLVEAQDLTTDAGREAVASLMTLGISFASVMDQMQQSIGLTGDSLKSVFQNVLKEANSAEEARMLGEQAAGQLLMDAISNALVGTVTDLVSSAVLQPITQSIVGAAAQAATMDVAAASAAGATLAAGGAAGGMNVAAGGAAGGANVAAGGAAAGAGLAEIVGRAVSVTNSMVEIMTSADFQAAFGAAVSAIGDISATLFGGMTSIQTSMPGFAGGGSAAISSGGGGGGGSSATDNKNPLEDLLEERRQLEIELLKAQGQEQEALNRIRAKAIEGMSAEAVAAWDFNRALEKQIEQAQQVADLKQEHHNLEIELLRAQGSEEEAVAAVRADAIKGMTAEAVALYDANAALQEQIEQAGKLRDLEKEGANLQIELLKAQGRDEEALALIREEAIKGLSAQAVAQYDANQAVQEQIDILNERKGLERRLLEAQGDTAAIRQLELAATHEANRAILLRIWALEDEKKAAEAAQTAVDAAFDALKRAVQSAQEAAEKALKDAYEATEKTLKAQISAAEKIRSAASESLSSLEGIFDLLKEQIKDLRNEAGAAAPVSEGNAYLDRLIASGAKPKQDELADAIESVRAGQKAERYGTAFEYNRDNLVLAGRLDVLQSKVGLQKTVAEQQLKAAEDSLVTLNEQLETAKTQYEEQLAKTKEYYEKVLENAQTQIDVLRGVDKSVLSVTAAVTALNAAVASAAAQVTAAVLSIDADTTTTTTATANDTSGTRRVSEVFPTTNLTYDDRTRRAWGGKVVPVNFRAGGGYTPAGLTVVGEEGPELVNFAQPSMVYTSAQTSNLLGRGDSEGVIAELRSLREDNRAQAQALVRMQARLVALMERWDGDGMPEERATA